MLRMLSSLESRHRLLHLLASLEREYIQPTYPPMAVGFLLSIPNYVVKKVRPHGNRHGKTEEQIKHFIAQNLRKRCIKKILKEFTIASRKIPDFATRNQNWSNWRSMHPDGQGCTERYHLSHVARQILQIQKGLVDLNTSGRSAPMKLRSDFNEALTKLRRLHRESGEERLAPNPSWHYQKWHPSSSSSSTSWWQWNDPWWSSQNS